MCAIEDALKNYKETSKQNTMTIELIDLSADAPSESSKLQLQPVAEGNNKNTLAVEHNKEQDEDNNPTSLDIFDAT